MMRTQPVSLAIDAATVSDSYVPANSNILGHRDYNSCFLYVEYTKGENDTLATIQIDSHHGVGSGGTPAAADAAWAPIRWVTKGSGTIATAARLHTFAPTGAAGTLNYEYFFIEEVFGEWIRVKVLANDVTVTAPIVTVRLMHLYV